MAVVYNCFAHLESIALEVMNCYAEEAPDRFPTPAAAHKLALADVVAWWRFELAAMARALRTSADRARFPRPSVFPCPLPRPLVLPRSPTRERPLYAIDATRHNKRRQNAATRRSRPSRPR